MNDLRFQTPPAISQLLPSARTADVPEDGEIFDSDDDLPSVRQILACPKRMIDLTCDGDDGSEVILLEVSWLRYTRTARHCIRLTSPSLTDRFWVVDQLRSPPIALSARVTGTHCRRRYSVVYSSHTR
jgi:hypothetical protein